MSDNNNNNKSNNDGRSFVPPPPPLPPAPPSSSATIVPPPTVLPPPPHSSHAAIPEMRSAPPSGNIDFTLSPLRNNTTQALSPSLGLPLPPPPRNTDMLRTPLDPSKRIAAPTMATLPPPMFSRVNAMATATPRSISTTAVANEGTIVELPEQQSDDNRSSRRNSSRDLEADDSEDFIAEESVYLVSEPMSIPRAQFKDKNMPAYMALRQYKIPILVVATEAAHRMAWQNKLKLVDLFEGLVQNIGTGTIPTPFRSVNKSLNLQWSDFQVTFCDADTSYNTAQIDTVQHTLQSAAALQPADGNLEQELHLLEDQVDNLLHNDDNDGTNTVPLVDYTMERAQKLEQVVKDAYRLTSPLDIPWLLRYRQALDETTRLQDGSMLATPPVVLYVATTNEIAASPIEALQQMQSPHFLPPPYQNGTFDPQSFRSAALVLQDAGKPIRYEEAYLRQNLLQSFGASATLLKINSIPEETAVQLSEEETSDMWGGGGTRGNRLSVADRVGLRKYLSHLLTSTVLPSLERRISDLNVIVSDRKKGVKNVFKSFWRTGKNAEDEPNKQVATSKDVKYRYDTIESQTMLLADTLFLLRDYENALSTYRLIKDDYKQDKAHLHYAIVQEMIALCLHQLDSYGRAREVFSHIENALLSYSRAAEEEQTHAPGSRPTVASIATRLATRLCLVLIAMPHLAKGRQVEVADLLASASSHETALGAAVLLEQSSAHYFSAKMYRKYAFHMLMSGHMFRTAQQEHHAFRCFTSALYIYRDSRWEELHNHLRSALAAQCFSMGRMALSLQLYAKLVGSNNGGRVSVKSQQKFVNHLLEICNEHTKKALVGADRMAAPLDSQRQERLDRIVQVVRYTKSASRVLELANAELPAVDDASITIVGEEAIHSQSEGATFFGEVKSGTDTVWKELELHTIAELRASESKSTEASTNKLLSKIKDVQTRNMIAQIDKEKLSQTLSARNKKSASYKQQPAVRAVREPMTVKFTINNPLSIPIDITALQLVARMTTEDGKQVCTNEDAIKITPLKSFDKKNCWTFHGSTTEFESADFCRSSTLKSDDASRQSWRPGEEITPLFVVTKSSLTLKSEGSETVITSICPLAAGNLEILGMRCRLFDDVWVYHQFEVKGQLLQNTRSNRANRVRSQSLLLKTKVEGGMPSLTVDLISPASQSTISGPALNGQVRPWLLRLSNVGTAPAGDICLKTNAPWIAFQARGESNHNEALPYTVGPTGTLFRLPIEAETLRRKDWIEPEESIEIPVDIRTSGSGKTDFYMLLRYKSESETKTKYRWLRKMIQVNIYPSLTMTTTVTPSSLYNKSHLLSLEVTNSRSDQPDGMDLHLQKISIVSRHYKLKPLIASKQSGNGYQLCWQEQAVCNFLLLPNNENDDDACVSSEVDLTASSSPKATQSSAKLSSVRFLCMDKAHEAFQETLDTHNRELIQSEAASSQEDNQPRSIAQIRRANTGVPEASDSSDKNKASTTVQATSIARLCPADQVHLICDWSDGQSIVGKHHIQSLSVHSTQCPISIAAKYPSLVKNDFHQGFAMVPCSVVMRNELAGAPVKFEVLVEQQSMFEVTGPEKFRKELDCGEEYKFELNACISSAGVYNLQQLRVTVENDDYDTFVSESQWLVNVQQT